MSISIVSGHTVANDVGGTNTTRNVTVSQPAVGNYVVLGVLGVSNDLSSVTQTGVNWQLVLSYSGNLLNQFWVGAVTSTASTTLELTTGSGSGAVYYSYSEWSGLGGLVVAAQGTSGTSSPATSPTVTTDSSGDLMIGMYGSNSSRNVTSQGQTSLSSEGTSPFQTLGYALDNGHNVNVDASFTIAGGSSGWDVCVLLLSSAAQYQQTLTGVSRIRVTTPRTQSGKSRITGITSQTQSGKSNIAGSTVQTLSGKSRVTAVTVQSLTGKSRVTAATVQTLSGVSRITTATPQSITGKANITAAGSGSPTDVTANNGGWSSASGTLSGGVETISADAAGNSSAAATPYSPPLTALPATGAAQGRSAASGAAQGGSAVTSVVAAGFAQSASRTTANAQQKILLTAAVRGYGYAELLAGFGDSAAGTAAGASTASGDAVTIHATADCADNAAGCSADALALYAAMGESDGAESDASTADVIYGGQGVSGSSADSVANPVTCGAVQGTARSYSYTRARYAPTVISAAGTAAGDSTALYREQNAVLTTEGTAGVASSTAQAAANVKGSGVSINKVFALGTANYKVRANAELTANSKVTGAVLIRRAA